MISTRHDEPDVIDLTASYGYYGSISFPIRPPSPFTDGPVWSRRSSQYNEDDDPDDILNWVSPTRQVSSNHNTKTRDNTIPSTSQSSHSSSRTHGTWRRTLSKMLKRTKSNEHKRVTPSTTSEIAKPYDFGLGEIVRTDSLTSRGSVKRVHWIDDDELILNACHRFVEYLKLYIQCIINDHHDKNHNEDNYLKNCQIALEELTSLIKSQQIKEAFEYIIELATKQDKKQLLEQQTYIENLIYRTVLFPSA